MSDRGEVKEAALWSGRLATCVRRATVIGDGGLATLTEEDDPGAGVVPVGRFLYEPDGAVIRAGLVTAVAAGVDGGLVDEHIAYVTTDASYRSPFARCYAVLEVLPHREKALRAALHERDIGRLTIKKRGVDVVPDQLRRRLALSGDDEAMIVLTRVAGEGTCLLVRSRSRRRRISPRASRSAPIVVSSPWPVCTTVSSGSANSLSRIDASSVGRSENDRPGGTRAALEQGVAGEHAAEVRRVEAAAAGRVARRVQGAQRRTADASAPSRPAGRGPTGGRCG